MSGDRPKRDPTADAAARAAALAAAATASGADYDSDSSGDQYYTPRVMYPDGQHPDTPLFMTAEQLQQGNETVEALQAMMFSGTPEENAEELKQQGNRALARGPKFYREAIKYYTEAIGLDVPDPKKRSVYFANRAHVHLLLENNGYALADALKATELDATNAKAWYRAARAALALRRWQEALQHAEHGLQLEPRSEALKQTAEAARAALERDRERAAKEAAAAAAATAAVVRVQIAIDEHQLIETAEAVSVDATLRDVLQHMYAEAPPWGPDYRFSPRMQVYYQPIGSGDAWVRARLDSPLRRLLPADDAGHVPMFHLVLAGTAAQQRYADSPWGP